MRRTAQVVAVILSIELIVFAYHIEHRCVSRDNPCTEKEIVFPWEK